MRLGSDHAAAFQRQHERPPVNLIHHQDCGMSPEVHDPVHNKWRCRVPLFRAAPYRRAQVRKRRRLNGARELAFVRVLRAAILPVVHRAELQLGTDRVAQHLRVARSDLIDSVHIENVHRMPVGRVQSIGNAGQVLESSACILDDLGASEPSACRNRQDENEKR